MLDGSHGSDEEDSSGEQGEERGRSARENHCEIERRRRNKMTQYITELSELIPECTTTQHKKLDKLTILRLAVTHMKKLQNNSVGGRPSFLTDQELKFLLLEAADGFLFVVHLSSGRFLYVSDTVTPVLGVVPAEWYAGTIFDHVHPDDVRKVQEQMSVTEGHRVLDLKTGTIKKESHQAQMRMGLGWRRSFVCRFRVGPHALPTGTGGSATNSHVARSRSRAAVEGPDGSQYAVVHISGQLKNYPTPGTSGDELYGTGSSADSANSGGSNHCLVAVARLQVTSLPDSMTGANESGRFTTRHSAALADESVLTFADQQMTTVLDWMPQELLGKNLLRDYIAPESQHDFNAAWEAVYHEKGQRTAYSINVLTKSGARVLLNINIEAFLNPYSEEMEFIICTHTNPLEQNRNPTAALNNSALVNSAQPAQNMYMEGSVGSASSSAALQMSRPSVIAQTQQSVYQSTNQQQQQQQGPGYYPSTIGLSFQQAHQHAGWASGNQNQIASTDQYLAVPQLPNAANWFFGNNSTNNGNSSNTAGQSGADFGQVATSDEGGVSWPPAVGVVGGETGSAYSAGVLGGTTNRTSQSSFSANDYPSHGGQQF